MTVMVVHGAKTVNYFHWETLDAKRMMPKSFTILWALYLMMTCCRFIMTVVFQYFHD